MNSNSNLTKDQRAISDRDEASDKVQNQKHLEDPNHMFSSTFAKFEKTLVEIMDSKKQFQETLMFRQKHLQDLEKQLEKNKN